MGTSHSFECKKCKSYIEASLKETEGMNIKVKAMKCKDCNEVTDCIIASKNDLYHWDTDIIPTCGACGSKNIIAWDAKCPVCSSDMIDDGLCRLWD